MDDFIVGPGFAIAAAYVFGALIVIGVLATALVAAVEILIKGIRKTLGGD